MSFHKPLLYAAFVALLMASCTESVHDAKVITQQPAIYPDYVGVTIPANIAPLNFTMAEGDALCIDAVIATTDGKTLHTSGKESTDFKENEWRQMLGNAVGDSLRITVSAKYDDGWKTYQPFTIFVSPDSIDYGITYRLIEPGYEVWSKMGIYERNLSTFDQRPLLENTQFQGCVNCHSTSRANPADMTLHIRGAHGATLLQLDGDLQAYNTATSQTLGLCVYPYWHPGGRYLAYSTNTTQQVFHEQDMKRVEVYDAASDLQIYDKEKNELILSPLLKRDSVMETFPAFSADGRTLYFCAARQLPDTCYEFKSVRYNLCSISFDPETGTIGNKIDTLINAERDGKSISFPRPSYDGRYLCYTLADYGQFSIWHKEADLYLLDLQADSLIQLNTKASAIRCMDAVNSADTESFHNWSSNSRWMVFSSRRDDGWFTRPYFTHIDEAGNATKPFMLPQRNPRQYYDELFMSYNVPEFISTPSQFDSHKAAKLINKQERTAIGVRSF